MTPGATVTAGLAEGSLQDSPTWGAWWMNSGGQDRAGAPFTMFSDRLPPALLFSPRLSCQGRGSRGNPLSPGTPTLRFLSFSRSDCVKASLELVCL